MQNDEKIVNFQYWCEMCEHFEKPEEDLPCRDCLDEPVNVNSTKPILWEMKEELK